MSAKLPHGPGKAHDIGDLDADELDASVEPEVLPDRAPDGVRRRSYDAAFEPAVARGLLTVQAAWARGSREAYAIGLQHRYGLSPALALEVADNSLSLLEALEILDRQGGAAPPEPTGPRRSVRRHLLPVALLTAGALCVTALWGQREWANQERIARELERLSFLLASKPRAEKLESPAPASSTEVLRDDEGHVTQVSGPTPRAVVEEICRLASVSGSCPSMDVRHSGPRQADLRVGWFVAESDDGKAWSVLLRRNRSSDHWLAGTGLAPIQPFPAGGPTESGASP